MEWRKLKNLIILILLVVNGFLLVLVASRSRESAQYEHSALEHTVQVLERGGIQVDRSAIFPATGMAPLSIERDLEQEARLARALLGGDAQGDNQVGGVYLYRSGLGEVSLRAGGELTAELAPGSRWETSRPEEHAAALLKELGVDAVLSGHSQESGQTTLCFTQRWDGAPVFSCHVEFTYREGRLCSLGGTLLITAGETAEPGEALTLPTALLRFSEEIAAAVDVCTNLRSMEPGWRGTAPSLSGGIRLTPVWLVTTDTASYYLDCATGALARAAETRSGEKPGTGD